ncbi:flagellar hook protein FlgE [Thermodesulfovibrionales bacterium]|nr:flagellar hook protein FlgE [Thermodesulfovibrionales bacterium]
MGLMTSLYTGVSGLSANGLALSIIGDNIANVNTTGFKKSRAVFGDIMSHAMGGAAAFQMGRGAMLLAVQQLFIQGALEITGNPLDMAIEGDGFFIVRDEAGAPFYTRAGQFSLNKDGYIVNQDGLQLQGFLLQQGGVKGDINVAAINSPPRATSEITIAANLDSRTSPRDKFIIDSTNDTIWVNGTDYTLTPGTHSGAAIAVELQGILREISEGTIVTYDAAGTEDRFHITAGEADLNIEFAHPSTTAEHMLGFISRDIRLAANVGVATSDYDAVGFDPEDAVDTSDFSTSITVFDSLGNSHMINIFFRKTAEAAGGNEWHWYAVIPSDSSATGQTQIGAQGSLTFDATGALQVDPAPEYNSFNFVRGVVQNQQIAFDFGRSIDEAGAGLDGTTQFGAPSSVLFQSQDGFTAGNLLNLVVDHDGRMSGIFTNGQVIGIADVALARFTAPTELTKMGSNLFAESADSGGPIIGAAGTGGRGSIFASSLEGSNVDLADEFIKMIAAQRGFQASTRVITTADSMLAELMGILR